MIALVITEAGEKNPPGFLTGFGGSVIKRVAAAERKKEMEKTS